MFTSMLVVSSGLSIYVWWNARAHTRPEGEDFYWFTLNDRHMLCWLKLVDLNTHTNAQAVLNLLEGRVI